MFIVICLLIIEKNKSDSDWSGRPISKLQTIKNKFENIVDFRLCSRTLKGVLSMFYTVERCQEWYLKQN